LSRRRKARKLEEEKPEKAVAEALSIVGSLEAG